MAEVKIQVGDHLVHLMGNMAVTFEVVEVMSDPEVIKVKMISWKPSFVNEPG